MVSGQAPTSSSPRSSSSSSRSRSISARRLVLVVVFQLKFALSHVLQMLPYVARPFNTAPPFSPRSTPPCSLPIPLRPTSLVSSLPTLLSAFNSSFSLSILLSALVVFFLSYPSLRVQRLLLLAPYPSLCVSLLLLLLLLLLVVVLRPYPSRCVQRRVQQRVLPLVLQHTVGSSMPRRAGAGILSVTRCIANSSVNLPSACPFSVGAASATATRFASTSASRRTAAPKPSKWRGFTESRASVAN